MNNENNITFHDEEVVENKKGPVSKKALYAFGLSFVFLFMILFDLALYHLDKSFVIVDILEIGSFIACIVLGIIALKEIKKKNYSGKKYAVMGIIFPFVFYALMTIVVIAMNADAFMEAFNQGFYCGTATSCVDNGDDTSTCKVNGEDFKCPNQLLQESQYKEGE